MKFYNTTFFVEKDEGIKVRIEKSNRNPYPYTVTITPTKAVIDRPGVTFFMEEECMEQFLHCIEAETYNLAAEDLREKL